LHARIVRDQVNDDVAKGTDKPLVPTEIRSIRDINKKCSAKVMCRVIWVAYLGEGPGDPSALANPAVVDTRYDRQCERNMRPTEMIVGSPGMVPMAQLLLEQPAARHSHLCPRQVLGVRMGLLAGRVLGLDVPNAEKRFLALATELF
jgi:hypothetical protein